MIPSLHTCLPQAFVLAATCLAFLGPFDHCQAALVIDLVKVGNPGNPVQPNVIKRDDLSTGYGRVDYEFQIAKYETTNDQFATFLNAVAKTDTHGLYDTRMGAWTITRSGSNGSYSYSARTNMGNKPTVYVSPYDAARFANWLHNGQPVGAQNAATTEDGAYTLSGTDSMSARKAGARFFLPTEHEWDKAAFYEPGATTPIGDGWWMYPSHSQVFPTPALADEFGNVTNPGPHTVNFRKEANWNGTTSGNLTTVGSAGNKSFYGAMDMAGNVFEWTEADPTKPDPNGWGPYTVRGGSFRNAGHVDVYERNLVHHDNHSITNFDVGFRLAAAAVALYAADFNGDGAVNGADLVRWKQNFGLSTGATKSLGDANADGIVDGRDLLAWQRELGSGAVAPAVGAVATVPEPASLGLLLGASLASFPFLRKISSTKC